MLAGVRRAIIVGGGVGGLSAAIALSRLGIECAIHERAGRIGVGGTALTLWPNALRALEKLDLDAAVLRHADPLLRGEILTWRGRRLTTVNLAEIARRSGRPLVCLRRSDLYGELLAAAAAVPIHTGRRCISCDPRGDGVVARFDDGSEAEADVLVAADGIRSRLRNVMLGDDPLRYVGWMTWRGVARLPPGTFPSGLYREFFGRGSRFGLFAIRADLVYWYGTLSTAADERAPVDPSHRGEAVAHFAGWPEPAALTIGATEHADLVRTGVYDTEARHRWTDGRMAILGDAAHPMTPDLGQGACQAIEDSLCLADMLAGSASAAEALARYEAAGRARTAGLVARSRRVGTMRQWRHPLLHALRSSAMRAIPPPLLLKMFETD